MIETCRLKNVVIFIQTILSTNINQPIKKLLVLINQSFTLITKFLIELKKQIGLMIWNKIQETSFANTETFKFYFQRKSHFYWRRNPSNKIFTVEEELGAFDTDDIGN